MTVLICDSPDDNDKRAQYDVVIDGPGDVLAFIKQGRGFTDHKTEISSP